jgi:hypothetical protein
MLGEEGAQPGQVALVEQPAAFDLQLEPDPGRKAVRPCDRVGVIALTAQLIQIATNRKVGHHDGG